MGSLPSHHKLSALEAVQVGIMACVVFFFLLDAVLVYQFRSMVEASVGNADAQMRIARWNRLCTISSAIGLSFYVVNVALEVYVAIVAGSGWMLPLLVLVLVVKGLRLMAFSTFAWWVGKFWSSQTDVKSAERV